jgi:hypothetical protein
MNDRADLFPEGDADYITPGGGVLPMGKEEVPKVLATDGECNQTDFGHVQEPRASNREESMEFYPVWRARHLGVGTR